MLCVYNFLKVAFSRKNKNIQDAEKSSEKVEKKYHLIKFTER